MKGQYNIRVYGILINDRRQVLLSDECYSGWRFTKFPGGGLEKGEGLIDALKREFMEELQLKIVVTQHFYTTDFFQASAFDPNQQLIGVYYFVKPLEPMNFQVSSEPFDFENPMAEKCEAQRWLDVQKLSPSVFKWPVDKHVCQILMEKLNTA